MNLPNLLSLFRLILVPVFVGLFFSDIPGATYYALGVYVVASFTDVLDGFLARKYQQITKLGRILDPLADKLMGAAVIVSICVREIVPWWAAAVFIAKELLMLLGASVLYRRRQDVPPSNYLGKAATASFFAVCVILLLFPQIPPLFSAIMIGIALLISVAAMLVYAFQYIKWLHQAEPAEKGTQAK